MARLLDAYGRSGNRVRDSVAGHLPSHDARLDVSALGFQDQFRVKAPKNVHQGSDETGPACLMARAQPCSVVAVEVLVEQDQVAPVWIFLEFLRASVNRPPAVSAAQEGAGKAACNLLRHFEERHVPTGSGR